MGCGCVCTIASSTAHGQAHRLGLYTKRSTMIAIVLLGPPGSGKGTQAEKLVEKYRLYHLSTGDVFRSNISDKTPLGELAKSFMDRGQLVPDDVTIQLLVSEIEQHPEAKGFIFDGFPRTISQAEALDSLLGERNASIQIALALDVEEEELKKRLKGRALKSGRTDDADSEVIQNRIRVYQEETLPLVAFYERQGKMVQIAGQEEVDSVTQSLYASIDKVLR